MDAQISSRIIAAHELAQKDSDYHSLLEEYRVRNAQLLAQLETMNPQQRSAVMDYLGLVGEMQRKLLEFACKV